MSRAKASTAAAPKASKSQATHPSWIDMIKACILAHPDHTRQGVSRPQIKKFVEQTYKLEMTNMQNAMLSKALGTGSEKGVFVLPKGPSGRVKLAPKTKTDTSAKENKPAKPRSATTKATAAKPSAKPAAKPTHKPGKASAKPAKATTRKQPTKSTTKSATGAGTTTSGKKATVGRPKSGATIKRATVTTKKVQAAKAKPSSTTRKSTATQRGAAKRSATGETAASKVKAASKRAPAKTTSSRAAAKATTAKAAPRKKPTKRS